MQLVIQDIKRLPSFQGNCDNMPTSTRRDRPVARDVLRFNTIWQELDNKQQ